MNVTLKLPDDLCRAAKHRAIEEDKSLSAWMTSLVLRELAASTAETTKPKTLAEAMTVPGMPDWFYEKDFALEDRRNWGSREFSFDTEKE